MFEFSVDKSALLLLTKAVDFYLEKWPGGHPQEQESLRDLKYELHKAVFEISFIKDED